MSSLQLFNSLRSGKQSLKKNSGFNGIPAHDLCDSGTHALPLELWRHWQWEAVIFEGSIILFKYHCGYMYTCMCTGSEFNRHMNYEFREKKNWKERKEDIIAVVQIATRSLTKLKPLSGCSLGLSLNALVTQLSMVYEAIEPVECFCFKPLFLDVMYRVALSDQIPINWL